MKFFIQVVEEGDRQTNVDNQLMQKDVLEIATL